MKPISGEDAYIDYDFTVPGTYYLQVETSGRNFIPIGASYELQVSIPGTIYVELIMKDGFESSP